METMGFLEVDGHQIASVFHRADSARLVIMCHGFRSSMIGPARTFVRLARDLQGRGVSVLRFDQYGSGNSEGSFLDSSFAGWIDTIAYLVESYTDQGYRVALLGQSMGGAAVICAAAELGPKLAGVAAWSPGVNAINRPAQGSDELMEEGGQLVRYRYWHEAHDAGITGAFARIEVPTCVWVATNDEYISPEENDVLVRTAGQHQTVRVLEGHSHSAWTAEQSDSVLADTTEFLVTCVQS